MEGMGSSVDYYYQLFLVAVSFLVGLASNQLVSAFTKVRIGVGSLIYHTTAATSSPLEPGNRLEVWDFPPAPAWLNKRTAHIGFGSAMEDRGGNGLTRLRNVG